VWETETGRLRHVFTGQRPNNWSVAFSPDGKTLAAGWGSAGVRLYDLATGWEVADLQVGIEDVRWLGFHPDGRSLGIVGSGPGEMLNLGVWDLATRQQIRRMPVPGPGAIGGAWRADGLLLGSSGERDGTVRLWSTDGKPERSQVIRLFPPDTPFLHGLAMSPEGRHLATANPDSTVTILRLAELGQVFQPTAPPIPK
jgi:WD40 repeat protein